MPDVDSFQTGEQHALALLPDLEEFGGKRLHNPVDLCASPGSLKYPKTFGGPSQNPGLSAPPFHVLCQHLLRFSARFKPKSENNYSEN